jgi:hypothetical protein
LFRPPAGEETIGRFQALLLRPPAVGETIFPAGETTFRLREKLPKPGLVNQWP